MEEKRKRGGPRGPRPHLWKTGPYDEARHNMFTPWMVSKAQANFRSEEFTLTFEEYYELWKNDWNNRGRKPDNMCMTRKDTDGPWSADNCYIISRREHLQIQGQMRRSYNLNYKPRYTKLKVQK